MMKFKRRTFYVPRQVERQASKPGLKKEQVTAILTYLNKNNVSPRQAKPKAKSLSQKQLNALKKGRKVLAQRDAWKFQRKFFGKEGDKEYGYGSGRAGQMVRTAAEESSATVQRREYMAAKKKYYSTKTGKVSAGVQRTFGFIKSPMSSLIRYSYGSQMPAGSVGRRTAFGRKGVGGGRGRPRGTFDSRYAAYGGVYGYRKAMAHQRAMEKLRARQQANLTPEQVMAIRATRARMANPETQTFPDTTGYVDTSGYMNEIDNAAGAGDKATQGMPD